MQYRQISLTELHRDPDQPRKDYQSGDLTKEQEKGLDELAGSLKAHGVIEPLVVAEDEEGYRIISGERRYLAAQRAGLTKVPCLVRSIGEGDDPSLQEAETLAVQLAENVMREDMSDYDVAAALASLRDKGMSRDAIADLMGQNPAWVSTRMTFYREANEAEQAGIKSAEVWSKFRRLPREKRAELIAEFQETGQTPTTGRIKKARTEYQQEQGQQGGYKGPKGPQIEKAGSSEAGHEAGEAALPSGISTEEASAADDWAAEAEKLLEEEPAVQGGSETVGEDSYRGAKPGKGYDPVRMGEPRDPAHAFSQLGGEANPLEGLAGEPPVSATLTESQWVALLQRMGARVPETLSSDALKAALLQVLSESSETTS